MLEKGSEAVECVTEAVKLLEVFLEFFIGRLWNVLYSFNLLISKHSHEDYLYSYREVTCKHVPGIIFYLVLFQITFYQMYTSYKFSLFNTDFQDSKLTNAGRGSSLNIRGCVECDASIMEGRKLLFGAVGAISGKTSLLIVFDQEI